MSNMTGEVTNSRLVLQLLSLSPTMSLLSLIAVRYCLGSKYCYCAPKQLGDLCWFIGDIDTRE